MIESVPREQLFTDVSPKADTVDPDHPDGRDALSDLDLQPGECRRVDGLPQGRTYHLRVGDLLLVIGEDSVYQGTPAGMHYDEAYGTIESVDAGEAFAFLHGDYSSQTTYCCLGCGVTHEKLNEKPCSCPIGSETKSTEWPDVPSRAPRKWIGGELLARPE